MTYSMQELPALTYLDLSYSDLSDADIDRFPASFERLALFAEFTNLTDVSAEKLSQTRGLKSFNIKHTAITSAGVRQILRAPHLHTLHVSWKQVQDLDEWSELKLDRCLTIYVDEMLPASGSSPFRLVGMSEAERKAFDAKAAYFRARQPRINLICPWVPYVPRTRPDPWQGAFSR